jgi:hypothetical protein
VPWEPRIRKTNTPPPPPVARVFNLRLPLAPFHVVRFDDEGETLTILKSFDDEEDADCFCDVSCNRYPFAYIDVLNDQELAESL